MTVRAHAVADRAVPNGAGRFLLYALGWNAALFGLLRLAWVEDHVITAVVAFQKSIVLWYGVAEHKGIVVNASCSGTDVMALCAGVVLAYPVAWGRRVSGAAGGLILILSLNMVRIGSLYLAGSDPGRFSLLHSYVWPATLALAAVGYVMTWIRLSDRRSVMVDRQLVRFGLFAAGALAIYAASLPWAFQSQTLVEIGAWTTSVGGFVLSALGVTVQATGNVLFTGRGGFQVTPECLFTPMIPLSVAALGVLPMSSGRRIGYLLVGLPLFFGLGVVRLLVLALPPFVSDSPAYLAHGFYQFVAAAVLLVGAAHWATRGKAPSQSSWTSASVLGVTLVVGLVAATPWRGGVEWVADALAHRLGITPLTLASAGDRQGALLLMPGFQFAVLCGLWLALTGGRAWRALGVGLGWLLGSQIGFIVGAAAAHAQWGVTPHAIIVRGWALGVPAIVALFWTRAAGSLVGDRTYWRFWQEVGEEFPVLTGAASTDYYFENEKRLLTAALPRMAGMLLLKTDLWDEAKNTRIMQWAADQGARIVGVDLSAPIVREAQAAFGHRTLRPVVGDVRCLPFASGAVDAIYSMGTVEHFAETEASIAECARVLRPGGRLILGVPNRHDPFLRPLMVTVLNWTGLYGYGFEKSFSRRALRRMVERAGLETTQQTAILFIPGWLRMLDLWCYTRVRPLARVTAVLIKPFVWMDRHLPWVRRHGYLTVNVSDKPGAASATSSPALRSTGVEFVVDASGCDPAALRSPAILRALFLDVVESLKLTPIGTSMWYAFPGEGGVTGIIMLSESHLSVHTYPETGFAAFDLYCCRANVDWPWKEKLTSALGAREVDVRVIPRGESRHSTSPAPGLPT